jgi:hypothetical protein
VRPQEAPRPPAAAVERTVPWDPRTPVELALLAAEGAAAGSSPVSRTPAEPASALEAPPEELREVPL